MYYVSLFFCLDLTCVPPQGKDKGLVQVKAYPKACFTQFIVNQTVASDCCYWRYELKA